MPQMPERKPAADAFPRPAWSGVTPGSRRVLFMALLWSALASWWAISAANGDGWSALIAAASAIAGTVVGAYYAREWVRMKRGGRSW